MDIETAIYSLCVQDTTISGLIGNNLFPYVVPQDELLPVVIYEIDEIENEHVSGGNSNTESIKFYINVFCSGYSDNQEIRDAFVSCLSRYNGTIEDVTIQKCFFTKGGSVYSPDENVYNGFLEFEVSYHHG